MARESDETTRHSIIVSAVIALLLTAALACGTLVAVPLWNFLGEDSQLAPTSDQCDLLKDVATRQACYDKVRLQEGVRRPAKGGDAPIRIGPREAQRD